MGPIFSFETLAVAAVAAAVAQIAFSDHDGEMTFDVDQLDVAWLIVDVGFLGGACPIDDDGAAFCVDSPGAELCVDSPGEAICVDSPEAAICADSLGAAISVDSLGVELGVAICVDSLGAAICDGCQVAELEAACLQ